MNELRQQHFYYGFSDDEGEVKSRELFTIVSGIAVDIKEEHVADKLIYTLTFNKENLKQPKI